MSCAAWPQHLVLTSYSALQLVRCLRLQYCGLLVRGAEIGTLGPLASIKLKIKNSGYDSRGYRVQKLGL